jgi:DNA-binding transcriptional LysR family regulator
MRVRVYMKSFDAVCLMVAGGVGVSIVPQSTARRLGRSTDIRIVLLGEDWATRNLKLIVRSLDGLAPYTKRFFQHLTSSKSPRIRTHKNAVSAKGVNFNKKRAKRQRK